MNDAFDFFVNPRAAGPQGALPLGPFTRADFDAAEAALTAWPGYAPSPLRRLDGLARETGLGAVFYKDEATRFGLGAFKPLGAGFAAARAAQRALAAQGRDATVEDIVAGRWREALAEVTLASATDGNHGRALAWAARAFGARCAIYIHAAVSQGRADAIAGFGAEVVRTAGGYDDSVREVFAEGARRGWIVVQDTAAGAYRDAPFDITAGYGLIAGETAHQIDAPPTHVFAQAGVGGLASALAARFALEWGARRPFFVTLEPTRAACVMASLRAGRPTALTGDIDTAMAGLSCGEVSAIAWEVLETGADAAISLSDDWAFAGMRRLADPLAPDAPIVGGECAGGAVGALMALAGLPEARAALGLDAASRILLIGTEGATDPAIYADVTGRAPEAVGG